ncbi:MAG TPA: YraN family protein, partial [Elusimicrobiales bacterium]|nr:YraN family protein [Elusimicrobiales bacterium]
AEDFVAEYLRGKGYKILDRRYSVHNCGELDIVASAKNCLVFVEVKARSSDAFGGAAGAVTAAKRKKLVRAALFYIKEKALKPELLRFDVVALTPDGLEHFENAFCPSEEFTY